MCVVKPLCSVRKYIHCDRWWSPVFQVIAGHSVPRERNYYHTPALRYFHSVINLLWCVGCFTRVSVCVCRWFSPGCSSNGAKWMIRLKRSDLSAASAKLTHKRKGDGDRIRDADIDRGRGRRRRQSFSPWQRRDKDLKPCCSTGPFSIESLSSL